MTATGPERLTVDLARLIHLTLPGDNARSLEGMLTSCATQPTFETPRHSWGPPRDHGLRVGPVLAGAEYRYRLVARVLRPAGGGPRGRERDHRRRVATLALPPTDEGQQYVFRVEAWKDGRLIGDLYTHDGGAHSWNYRFQVRNGSLPRWVYLAAAGATALLLLCAYRVVDVADPARRRRRIGLLLGRAYRPGRARRGECRRLPPPPVRGARAAPRGRAARRREAARQARQRELTPRSSRRRRVPSGGIGRHPVSGRQRGRPARRLAGYPRGELGDRQFFKAAYQGIVDHPDDEHRGRHAIMLLDHVAGDYPHRLELARWLRALLPAPERTDNCANCMVGDTTQGLTENLSRLYVGGGPYDDASWCAGGSSTSGART